MSSESKTVDKAKEEQIEKLKDLPEEKGGPKGPEPTRYGDWEQNGKCVDF